MSHAIRNVGLALSFAAVVVPGLAIALATASALGDSVSAPFFASSYVVAYLLWWPGLAAAFALPGRITKQRRSRPLVVAVATVLLVGLAACAWIEWSALVDSKRITPAGFFVVPFVGAVFFAALSKNAGSQETPTK